MEIGEICAVFGLGRVIAPAAYVARGELGRVSRLATSEGIWAVKEIDRFVPTEDEADANVDLQEAMLAVGVHLPRPRRTLDGHGIHGNVRVYEWLDMIPVAPGDAGSDAQVAAALAAVHVHAPPTTGSPDPWYCQAPSRAQWAQLLATAPDARWSKAVGTLIDELADVAEPAHDPARVCHLDVCPENVFLVGDQLTIIDWENAGPAATAQDLGSSLWDFGRGDIERTRAFVNAYRCCGGPIDRFDASVFEMARVVQANLIHLHARRLLDPATAMEDRRRAEMRLRDGLHDVLTRSRVDEIVER